MPSPSSGIQRRTAAVRAFRIAVATLVVAAAPARAQDEGAVAAAPEKPFSAMSRMLLGKGDSVAALARDQVGLKYRYGAKQPGKAFDCSGLVQFVLSTFDVSVPRTAHEQAKLGDEIPKDKEALQPGDLLYFGKGKRVTHIGIYIGDGRYVHAANRRKGVIESALPALNGSRRAKFWRGVRRLLHLESSDPIPPAPTMIDSLQVPVMTATEVSQQKH